MEIYYYAERWLQGPIPGKELAELVKNGEIAPDTPVWPQTNDDWIPAAFFASLAEEISSDETPVLEYPANGRFFVGQSLPQPRDLFALRLARDQNLITPLQAGRLLDEVLQTPAKAHDVPGKLHRWGWITAGQRSSLSCLIQAQPNQQILAGYEILEKLGSGSMGTTFRARQISLDRTLALKVLLPRFSQDPEYVRRFMREARLAAKLNHENIATAYEVGSSGGQYFLAMELVEGRTINAILREDGPLPEATAAKIVIKCAQALQYAHETGIIHRDISPKNIIVRPDGTPKLIDLGLAKTVTSHKSDDTGTAIGTPAYISPEQALGRKKVDIRSDIYSLGCVFFEMLTGHPPYQGESALETISMHLNQSFPPITSQDVGAAIRRIVKKMTQRNPNSRYQEPQEVVEDLERALETARQEADDVPPVLDQLSHWQGVQPVEIVMRGSWREYMHLVAQEIADRLDQEQADPEFQGYVQTTFTELVSNAFDHGCPDRDHSQIHIRMELNKAFFRLEVEDRGPGFAANEMLRRLREAPANRERQRGIIQILQIVDILEYNETGNRVKAVLYRKSRGSGIFEETREGIRFAEVKGKGDMALTEAFRRWEENFPATKQTRLCLMLRTDWVSSMFVGTIAKLSSKIEETGGRLSIWVERPSCRRIMHQLGINTFVDIHSAFDTAVKALK